jgi:4'-phosphopantetheinyl transferase
LPVDGPVGAGLPGPGEVHVWIVELLAPAATVEGCAAILSPDETERAERFRFKDLRTAYVLGRGCLRTLLARYAGSSPGDIRFTYGANGKPRLAIPDIGLEFNISHSGTHAAYALARCAVGVDIERLRPARDQEDIVRRFFAGEESQEWLALDSCSREKAFFRYWTAKEAYVKATGDGLSMPLDSFRVSLPRESGPGGILAAPNRPQQEKWLLFELKPADGYVGAIAVPERVKEIRVLAPRTAAAVLERAGIPAPPGPSCRHSTAVSPSTCPSVPS